MNYLAKLAIAPYIIEIKSVAQRGHKDGSTEHLLRALVELHHDQTDLVEEFVVTFLQRALKNNLEVTPRAFRLSLLTAIKLFLRKRGLKEYEFFSVKKWKHVVLECLSQLNEEFIGYCLRDVSTVKIYRYIALQILGGMLNQSQNVFDSGLSILDGGCSINIGLKCLNTPNIFHPVSIAPEIVRRLGGELPAFPLKRALGIDKYPPSLERTLASLFPSEVKIWEDLYTTLYHQNKKKVLYQQQDILYLDHHQEFCETFDIIFLSSLLRRFPPHQIADVLVQVNYATTRQGFLVINEQMSKEVIEGGGNYATYILSKESLEDLVRQSRQITDLYDLLNAASQVLIYPDENCQHVFPGDNFAVFLERDLT